MDTPWSIYLSRFYGIKTLYWWWSNHKFCWRKSMRIYLLYHQLTFKVNRKFSLFTTSFCFKCNNNTSINIFYLSISSFPDKEAVFSGINTGSLLFFSIKLANFYEEIKLNTNIMAYGLLLLTSKYIIFYKTVWIFFLIKKYFQKV